MENLGRHRIDTGRTPGGPTPPGCSRFEHPSPIEIQRFGALRESIPEVWERFPRVLWGPRGPLSLLIFFTQPYDRGRQRLDDRGPVKGPIGALEKGPIGADWVLLKEPVGADRGTLADRGR